MKITQQLQDYTEIKANKFKFNLKRFSVTHMLEELVEDLEQQFLLKDVKILKQIDVEYDKIVSDYERIQGVLMRLLQNALKYSYFSDQIVLKVKNFYEKGRVYLKCSVKDQGIGILSENIPEIFKMFVNNKKEDEIQKAHIGLPVASAISRVLGAGKAMECTSIPDQRTKFSFYVQLDSK